MRILHSVQGPTKNSRAIRRVNLARCSRFSERMFTTRSVCHFPSRRAVVDCYLSKTVEGSFNFSPVFVVTDGNEIDYARCRMVDVAVGLVIDAETCISFDVSKFQRPADTKITAGHDATI